MRKLLRIWRSMVSVFRADRKVVKACKEARGAHREALANDLDMALEYGDSRHAWELARPLANKTARSVKPRPIPPTRETASRDGCPYEEGLWCGPDDGYRQHSGSRSTVQCGSMAEIAAMIPPHRKTSPSTCKIPCGAKLGHTQRDSCDVLGWCGVLASRMAWYAINCFLTARYSQYQKKAAVHQFAGWRRQIDLWRVAGAHGGPLPSLAVRLCAQPRGLVGPSGSVLQRQGGAQANNNGTLLRRPICWTESSFSAM